MHCRPSVVIECVSPSNETRRRREHSRRSRSRATRAHRRRSRSRAARAHGRGSLVVAARHPPRDCALRAARLVESACAWINDDAARARMRYRQARARASKMHAIARARMHAIRQRRMRRGAYRGRRRSDEVDGPRSSEAFEVGGISPTEKCSREKGSRVYDGSRSVSHRSVMGDSTA